MAFPLIGDKKFEENKTLLATKDDIAKLEIKIAEAKADYIKWSFVFFAGIMLAVIGLYFKS